MLSRLMDWFAWSGNSLDRPVTKLLVLFGIINSPSFETFRKHERWFW